jgi:HEAT repeat protein
MKRPFFTTILVLCGLLLALSPAFGIPPADKRVSSFAIQKSMKIDGIKTRVLVAPTLITIHHGQHMRTHPGSGRMSNANIHISDNLILIKGELTDNGKEATVFRIHSGVVHFIWQGKIGPQGLDRTWSKEIEVKAGELLRFQRAPAISLCNGRSPRLYRERFSWQKKRFVPISPERRQSTAPVITSQVDPRPRAHSLSIRVESASSSAHAENVGEIAPPKVIEDGDAESAWYFRGNGRGEFFTFRSRFPGQRLAGIRIVPQEKRSNRVRRARLLFDGDQAFQLVFPAKRQSSYFFPLPKITSNCTQLVFDETTGVALPPIREVHLLSQVELSPSGPIPSLVTAVETGGRKARLALRLLKSRAPLAIQAMLARLKAENPPAENAILRLRLGLAFLSAKTSEHYVAGLRSKGTTSHRAHTFIDALIAAGSDSIEPLAALIFDAKEKKAIRIYGLEALRGIADPRVLPLLVRALAIDELRIPSRSSLHHLRLYRERLFTFLQSAEKESQQEADLWKSISRAECVQEPWQSHLQERLTNAKNYELRFRLVSLAGGCASSQVQEALVSLFSSTQDSPKSHALAHVAARATQKTPPSPTLMRFLQMLTVSPNPGVRLTAAASLQRYTDKASTRRLAEILQNDHWPEVRISAAASLGAHCKEPAVVNTLQRAIEIDAETVVQITALVSLSECEAPLLNFPDFLFSIAENKKAHSDLRQKALAFIDGRNLAHTKRLMALFRTYKRGAWGKRSMLRLAEATANLLGDAPSKKAYAVLLSAARDPSFPGIQGAAILALSKQCQGTSLALFKRLRRADNHQVALAARTASAKCSNAKRSR